MSLGGIFIKMWYNMDIMDIYESEQRIYEREAPPVPQDTTDYDPPEEAYEPEWVFVDFERINITDFTIAAIAKSIQKRQGYFALALENEQRNRPDIFTDVDTQIKFLERINQIYGAMTTLNELGKDLIEKSEYHHPQQEKSAQLELFDATDIAYNSGMCYNNISEEE